MTLNVSGPISLAGATTGQSIAVELGVSSTGTISLNDTNVRTLAGVASGVIIMPTNFYGKSASIPFTEASYTVAGTYTFVVPSGVTEVCCLTVGGGGGNSAAPTPLTGGGGALSFSNAIPTTPGESLTVFVGAGGLGPTATTDATIGQASYLARGATVLVRAQAPVQNNSTGTGAGGQAASGVGAVRYSGGSTASNPSGGGGGASGYSGNGGDGSLGTATAAPPGGGGAGGSGSANATGPGGGVGIQAEGAPGASGSQPGSGGSGQTHGGGGRKHGDWVNKAQSGSGGGVGAVRIIYGGTGKTFPNNSTYP
jgi:hypothetical protein